MSSPHPRLRLLTRRVKSHAHPPSCRRPNTQLTPSHKGQSTLTGTFRAHTNVLTNQWQPGRLPLLECGGEEVNRHIRPARGRPSRTRSACSSPRAPAHAAELPRNRIHAVATVL